MPARKPKALNKRHDTKEDKAERESSERAMMPVTALTVTPPPALRGHATAAAHWRALIGLYAETEGTIVTAFDADLLSKYCLLEEECIGMEKLRDGVLTEQQGLAKQLKTMKPKADTLKDYLRLLEQSNALLARYQGLDARLDGKRKLLHALSQSLYLTPRSRAGAAPAERPPEEKADPIEDLL